MCTKAIFIQRKTRSTFLKNKDALNEKNCILHFLFNCAKFKYKYEQISFFVQLSFTHGTILWQVLVAPDFGNTL